MEAGSVVITFVHGTRPFRIFEMGRRYNYAPWRHLQDSLQNLLHREGHTMELRQFHWGGQNSHSARLGASDALRKMLEDALRKRPAALHYVIAHSHGGNLAARAARNLIDSPQFRAVIALATPFIYVSKKVAPQVPIVAAVGWFSAIPLAVFWHLGWLRAVPFAVRWQPDAGSTVLIAAACCLLALLFTLVAANAALIKADLPPDLHPTKLWVVTITNDEAFAFLKGWQTLSTLGRLVSQGVIAIERVFQHRSFDYAIYGLVAIVLANTGLHRLRLSAAWTDFASGIAGMLLLVTLLGASVTAASLLLITGALFGTRFFQLGFQLAVAAPYTRLAIESAPQGSRSIHQLEETATGFQHSKPYQDAEAIEKICATILEDIRKSKLSPVRPGNPLGLE